MSGETAIKNLHGFHDALSQMMEKYVAAKKETFARHPLGTVMRQQIPELLFDSGIVDRATHSITGSIGQGNWVTVPWLAVFDNRITTSAQEGIYIVYLFSADGGSVYLTLNQGCTKLSRDHTPRETIDILHEEASKISGLIDGRGFGHGANIDLGDNLPQLALYYQEGCIFYKQYSRGSVPGDNVLSEDLKEMVDIYQEYYQKFVADDLTDKNPPTHKEPEEEKNMIKQRIENIKKYVISKGFSYEPGTIENLYLSLKSKPFVLLAGISGTGKSKLAELFAEAIGAKFLMVPVRPDWSDSSDILGHLDLSGNYIAGKSLEFINFARNELNTPYILCFDEMNLARVEYYFSEFLSVMETRKIVGNEIITKPLLRESDFGESAVKELYGEVSIPENLYIIGTVNMDETTFPFSRKVLDRANTIEFSYINLIPEDKPQSLDISPLHLENEFLKARYLQLFNVEDTEESEKICVELQEYNRVLESANAHIGYRVRDEIVFYMLNNKEANLLERNEAFDLEIMQKILPRIQGSDSSTRNVLLELFKLCAGNYSAFEGEDVADRIQEYLETSSIKYPKSAKKIWYMIRRYEEDGFTTYWV
jgi:MoxR-like ATPase